MSDSAQYQPISCALHSEYELLAMHRSAVEVIYQDQIRLKGIVTDIRTSQGAEYMRLETEENDIVQIRLDKIMKIIRVE